MGNNKDTGLTSEFPIPVKKSCFCQIKKKNFLPMIKKQMKAVTEPRKAYVNSFN